MGEVFEAFHCQYRLRVAIKFLRGPFQHAPSRLARLFREAIASGSVEHPGLVRVFDAGQLADGTAYLLMEFVPGDSLRSYLDHRRGELSLLQIVRILRQVASAIAAAHQQNIVHRDLKPENIMVAGSLDGGSDLYAKVVDFGLARFLRPDPDPGWPVVYTTEGSRPGTPAYMAPEQLERKPATDRSDVFALGMILAELGTGELPVLRIQAGQAVAPTAIAWPLPVRALGEAMLATVPTDRPSMAESAAELATIEAVLSRQERPLCRRLLALPAVQLSLVSLFLFLVVLVSVRREPRAGPAAAPPRVQPPTATTTAPIPTPPPQRSPGVALGPPLPSPPLLLPFLVPKSARQKRSPYSRMSSKRFAERHLAAAK
jgi:serine/threonine protein kinase